MIDLTDIFLKECKTIVDGMINVTSEHPRMFNLMIREFLFIFDKGLSIDDKRYTFMVRPILDDSYNYHVRNCNINAYGDNYTLFKRCYANEVIDITNNNAINSSIGIHLNFISECVSIIRYWQYEKTYNFNDRLISAMASILLLLDKGAVHQVDGKCITMFPSFEIYDWMTGAGIQTGNLSESFTALYKNKED